MEIHGPTWRLKMATTEGPFFLDYWVHSLILDGDWYVLLMSPLNTYIKTRVLIIHWTSTAGILYMILHYFSNARLCTNSLVCCIPPCRFKEGRHPLTMHLLQLILSQWLLNINKKGKMLVVPLINWGCSIIWFGYIFYRIKCNFR